MQKILRGNKSFKKLSGMKPTMSKWREGEWISQRKIRERARLGMRNIR